MLDAALKVIGPPPSHLPAEKLKGPPMRTDPVPQILAGRGFREGIAAGAQHRHEYGRGMYLTALRVVDRNRGPGVVHEHLLAGAVLLPQHQVELLQPSSV